MPCARLVTSAVVRVRLTVGAVAHGRPLIAGLRATERRAAAAVRTVDAVRAHLHALGGRAVVAGGSPCRAAPRHRRDVLDSPIKPDRIRVAAAAENPVEVASISNALRHNGVCFLRGMRVAKRRATRPTLPGCRCPSQGCRERRRRSGGGRGKCCPDCRSRCQSGPIGSIRRRRKVPTGRHRCGRHDDR